MTIVSFAIRSLSVSSPRCGHASWRGQCGKVVDDNIRNQQSPAIVSELHGDPWATGCLDRLREAGYRIRLLLLGLPQNLWAELRFS